jgi:predicted protein tyrosine phosphatase
MKIFVCPLSRVAELVALHRPGRVVSLLDPETVFPELGPSYAGRHLRLQFHDITIPRDNYTMPQAEHVAELLDFVSACQPTDSILIHCFAGISRSTAAAYIASCAARPDADEHALAVSLRQRAPLARPNGALVALADHALGREGRMSTGIALTYGDLPWIDVDEGEPFALSLAHD